MNLKKNKIAVIGLGYVGLPLAVEFGKKYETIGFDIKNSRIHQLISGIDLTLECSKKELKEATKLSFTNKIEEIRNCNIFIVTVPTPIDKFNRPDLTPLIMASETVSKVIKKNDIVIYESTVYPGATEEDCIPIIERLSGLKFNVDFFAGYSPERINPGDKKHRFPTIKKITSGSTPRIALFVDELYKSVVIAGTHKASSIKVAEAAKVIENTQRDLNIALINELALIFNIMNIDTEEVLKAAGSKWNFLPFRPGLVGGHCIGVDPYYLTHKAQSLGYHPGFILAGRRINDSIAKHIVSEVTHLMMQKRIHIVDSKILVMGLTFKENCPDIRNSKVIDIINELKTLYAKVDVYDPWVESDDMSNDDNIKLIANPKKNYYDAIIIAVGHDNFKKLGSKGIRSLGKLNSVLYDVKYVLDRKKSDGRL